MARKDAHVVTGERGTSELKVCIWENTAMFKATGMDEVNQGFCKVSWPTSKKEGKPAMRQRKSSQQNRRKILIL